MPVPGGEITTSEILIPKLEEVIEIIKEEDAELLERLKDEDDLPELS